MQPERKSILRSFKHRNFRLFFGGQLISLIGTWMQMVAESWLIYRLSHSAVLLGFAGFANQIPAFLLAPVGGVVADRHYRRRILVITQSCAMGLAFALSLLTLTHVVQVWHVLSLAAMLGVVNAFDMPARQSFIVEMVGKDDLSNAIGLNSSMFNGARIVGPAIAGLLVAWVGEGWCFFFNGLSYIAVISGLLLMKVPKRTIEPRSSSTIVHILEGFRYVGKTMPIRSILMLLGVVSFMGTPYTVLMPIFADHILNGGPKGMGILMGMSGSGALMGALLLTFKKELKGLGRWIALSSLGFGLSLMAFSQSKNFTLSGVLLMPVGFCMMVQMASSNTLIQSMVPDRLRGRVMSVYMMMFMGMAPFGSLLGGALAKSFGAPVTVLIGGAACCGGALIFIRNLEEIRSQARDLVLSQR